MFKRLLAFRQAGTKVERCNKFRWQLQSTTIAATLMLAAVFCQSCEQVTQNNPSVPNSNPAYKIEIIDSCEYIVRENGMTTFNNYSFALTHKGNCKFCKIRLSSVK